MLTVFPPCLAAVAEASFLVRRATELIEDRAYDTQLAGLLKAIELIDPDWLDERMDAMVRETLAAPDDGRATDRARAWIDADYQLHGIKPSPLFTLGAAR